MDGIIQCVASCVAFSAMLCITQVHPYCSIHQYFDPCMPRPYFVDECLGCLFIGDESLRHLCHIWANESSRYLRESGPQRGRFGQAL